MKPANLCLVNPKVILSELELLVHIDMIQKGLNPSLMTKEDIEAYWKPLLS